ncbi:MAG: GIY-YIG nuclease family protein [Anaerolineae bacterium]
MEQPESPSPEWSASELAPAEPGSYVLVMHLERPAKITIGRLGTWDFEAGYYAYAGSALGPGGLAARLSYHARTDKLMQWHIDYLLAHAELVEIWYAVDNKRKECIWASALRAIPGSKVPVPSFGASDCRCLTHLVYFSQQPTFASFARALSDLEF